MKLNPEMTHMSTSLFLKVVEETIPRLIHMNASKSTRQKLTGKRRLKPRKEHLVTIPPYRVCRIDRTSATSFIVQELRRNVRANNILGEIVHIS
jgi:hypothetical protein